MGMAEVATASRLTRDGLNITIDSWRMRRTGFDRVHRIQTGGFNRGELLGIAGAKVRRANLVPRNFLSLGPGHSELSVRFGLDMHAESSALLVEHLL
jgi:hypothetical protein